MNAEEKVIHYNSPEAASIQTVTGWVSREGKFWGKDEHMARWQGSTHTDCSECGALIKQRAYTICETCRANRWRKTYESYPFKEWDFETPVYSHRLDEYFFSPDEIQDRIDDWDEENKPAYEELQLVLCEPNHAHEIDLGWWSDDMPENGGGEGPKGFIEKINEFNAFLKTLPPLSWSDGKVRTSYKP